VSAIFSSYWWVGVLLALGAMLAWRMWTGSPQGSAPVGPDHPRLPIIGPLVMKSRPRASPGRSAPCSKGGVPVMSALAVVGDTMTNQAIGQASRGSPMA
jgi:type II secretory pathway component PulF